MDAKEIYWLAVALIAVVILTAGATDLLLWLFARPTITDYLRNNPAAFWVPVTVTVTFLFLLSLHLYFRPPA